MTDAARVEDRARPLLVMFAWAFALPVGGIAAYANGHTGVALLLTVTALALGWCDT